eukprot:236311-Hanusia_phi.AAC.3
MTRSDHSATVTHRGTDPVGLGTVPLRSSSKKPVTQSLSSRPWPPQIKLARRSDDHTRCQSTNLNNRSTYAMILARPFLLQRPPGGSVRGKVLRSSWHSVTVLISESEICKFKWFTIHRPRRPAGAAGPQGRVRIPIEMP